MGLFLAVTLLWHIDGVVCWSCGIAYVVLLCNAGVKYDIASFCIVLFGRKGLVPQ